MPDLMHLPNQGFVVRETLKRLDNQGFLMVLSEDRLLRSTSPGVIYTSQWRSLIQAARKSWSSLSAMIIHLSIVEILKGFYKWDR